MEYFVLALFINAVASNPYYVLKNSGLDEHNTEYSNHELNVARNEEYYLAHNEPSYMSPVPTKRDRDNEVITINPRRLRDPHGIEQSSVTKYENERNIDNIRESVQNYRQASSRTEHAEEVSPISNNVVISRSYSNPSAVGENNLLNRLIQQTKPIANSVVSSPLWNKGQSKIEKRDLEVSNHHQRPNNQQPLRIQARPERRIVFQESVVPDLKNIELYRRQVTPAKRIDLNREWSKNSNENAHLPDWLTERLKYPVDFPKDSQQSASTVKKPDIHKIITDPRIHSVVTSTKQTKRYMVIHPDGTVEHVDSLEPISEKHPNYVLVKAEQFLNNDKSKEGTNQKKPISSVSNIVSLNTKSFNSVENPQAVVEDIPKRVSLPAAVIKRVTSSEQTIIPQPSVASSLSTLNTDIGLPPTITSEITKLSRPIEKPQAVLEVIHKKEAVKIEPTTASKKVSEPTRIPQPSVVTSSAVADIILSSTNIPKTTVKTLETTENAKKINKPVNDEIEDENITACSNNSDIITSNNEADENVVVAEPISQDVTFKAKINESTHDITSLVETTPISEITKKVNKCSLSLENSKVSDAAVQSNLNVENEVEQPNEVIESPRSGGPVVFDTSDPDFWKKVTEGRDSDNIFFFLFKSGPKVEKNTVRTVFPDGSVLEELTETVWEEEDAEPKITKSLNVIPPGGL